MSIRKIIEYPDSVLRRRTARIEHFDDKLLRLVEDLKDTLYSSTGIGLSAPQIGESERMLVMDLSDNHSAIEVYVNPAILNKSGMAFVEESCLSLPGISASVVRAAQITVCAQDVRGDTFERVLEGMPAVCLQHELDHLDGTLFIDRISTLRSLRFRKTLKALEQRAALCQQEEEAIA
ncbi:MAG: peptide deformylase [Granulosicoccus sp.]